MIDQEVLRTGALLFEQYYAAMLRRAGHYVSDIHDAEDIVSSCWIRLLPKIFNLMKMDEPARSAYLMTAVQNEAVDYHRKNQRRQANSVELDDNIADAYAEEAYDSLILCDTLSTLLMMLPPQEARIVRCKLQGMSNEQIAELLHISQSTVRVYWLRGRTKLRQVMQALDK